MNWKINIDKDKEIIFLESHGKFDMKKNIEMGKELFETGNKSNIHRYFVDHSDALQDVDILGLTQLPDIFESCGLKKSDKVAAIVYENRLDEMEHRHFKRVVANKGFNIKFFNNKEEAIEWLLQ